MQINKSFNALIEQNELISIIHDNSIVLFDVRFSLSDTEAGRKLYDKSHLPGAIFLDLDRDLSGKVTKATGRHPLPNIEFFTERLRECGVSKDSQIIVYDDLSGAFAARLWWMFKWLGHDQVAVLNGGFKKWQESGYELSNAIPKTTRGNFESNVRNELLVNTMDLVNQLNNPNIILIDARTPERYRGEVEPIDKVAGHVPNAQNLPFTGNLNKDGLFLNAERLKERYCEIESAVHMCGSGVTGCHNVLASFIANNKLPKLYAGSWSEWITDASRPVEIGE